MKFGYKTTKSRFPFLDWLRGIAVMMMMVFHFFYDLGIFSLVKIDFSRDPFWYGFPRFIVFVFLICVGMGLYLVHHSGRKPEKMSKRLIKLGVPALLITLFTYIAFPKNYIFFGTLHCIAVCSLIATYLVPYPKLCLALFFLIIPQHLYYQWTWFNFDQLLSVKSMDYIPVYPWIAVVFLGIFLGDKKFHEIKFADSSRWRWIHYLGQHSLVIYLIHQPIFYGLIMTWLYFFA